MNINYVEKAVDIIFENYNHDARIIELFQNIKGGCRTYPPTEWYGQVFIAFKISLDENLIIDEQLKTKAKKIVSELSKYFNLP